MKTCTAAQMREIDRASIEDYGMPGVVLMEAAGRGVADLVRRLCPQRHASVVIICGTGNNGGDGFVTARHLLRGETDVVVYLVGDEQRIAGDARINYDILRKIGGQVRCLRSEEELAAEASHIAHARVVVDALFGTGLAKEVGGLHRQVLEELNRSRGIKVAVDVPSGLDADTGRVLGVAFAADHTVTFGYPKVGMVGHPGSERVGELHLVDIGIPCAVERQAQFAAEVLEPGDVAARLLDRPVWGHKGTYGHLLVIAGSVGKTGAALLCADAALRSGLGLCTIAAPVDAARALEAKTLEVMVEALVPEGGELDDSDAIFRRLEALLVGKSAIAVGPGIPRGPGTPRFIGRLVKEAQLPMVLDADALNDLVGQVQLLRESRVPLLLTPHPGEMARLIGGAVDEIQGDRLGTVVRFAVQHGVYVALKGYRTTIAAPDGTAFINPTGNSGMGSGGTGDVLTGLVGGFLGQRHDPLDALTLGVYVHGMAGDRAACIGGQRSMVARDLLGQVGGVLKEWEPEC